MSVGGVRASGGVGVLDDEVVDKMQILWWWWIKMKGEEDEVFKYKGFLVNLQEQSTWQAESREKVKVCVDVIFSSLK